jgi:rRNA pseudouridine-1189 N-methylase Emg1 (Nep1/Mra1 family)
VSEAGEYSGVSANHVGRHFPELSKQRFRRLETKDRANSVSTERIEDELHEAVVVTVGAMMKGRDDNESAAGRAVKSQSTTAQLTKNAFLYP